MPLRSTGVARRLRNNATSAERVLWRTINRNQIAGFRFRRQVPLCGYVVDFACFEARLIIELDGATHSTAAEISYDEIRQRRLEADGYSVLRFYNADVFENLDGVAETIRLRLHEIRPRLAHDDDVAAPLPVPPPQGGRGR